MIGQGLSKGRFQLLGVVEAEQKFDLGRKCRAFLLSVNAPCDPRFLVAVEKLLVIRKRNSLQDDHESAPQARESRAPRP